MHRMRLQTTALINIQVEESSRLSPEQMMPFPWDKRSGLAAAEPVAFTNDDAHRIERSIENIKWSKASISQVTRLASTR